MYFELKENKPHGTKDDPFSTYHIKNKGRSFQIPVHWHDELEIIYVKSGFLTVILEKPGTHLWYRREVCISWAHKPALWIILLFYFR